VPEPAVAPVTFPDGPSTVTVLLRLVHVPPVTTSVSNVVTPTHSDEAPCIGPGLALIVTVIDVF